MEIIQHLKKTRINNNLLYKNDTKDGYKDGKRIMIKDLTIFQACKVDVVVFVA